MSFTGPAPNINLNQANLVLTDATKRIKTPKVEFTTYDSTGVTIGKLGTTTLDVTGNVYLGSNTITANGSNLTGLFPSGEQTYGGSDALVTSIQIDASGKVAAISERSISFTNVVDVANSTANTLIFNTATTAIDAYGNVETDRYFVGDGSFVTNTTDVTSTAVGSATSIPTIIFDANGRISAVGSNTISTTLQGVVSTGNTASNTIELTTNTVALVTDGRVGVANTAPGHTFAVGETLYVDNSDLSIRGGYFHGNASNLTAVSDVSDDSVPFGDSANVAQITFDANGRISTVSNVAIASKVTSSTDGYVAFYNGNGQVVDGDSGLIYNSTNESLTVGGAVNVGGDITITGNLNITGNTTVTENIVFEDPTLQINAASSSQDLSIVFTRPTGNVAMGWLGTNSAYDDKLVFGYTSNNGATPYVDIDADRGIEAKFFGNVTADYFVGNGSALSAIDASNITAGTLSNDRLPTRISVTTLAGSGNTISNISASNIAFGTLDNARLPSTVSVTTLEGAGSGITSLNADNISSGTINNARLPATVSVTTLEGAGSGITSLNADNIASGTLNNARLPSTVSVTTLEGAGSGISALNASNISSGTLDNARLPTAISVTSLAGSGNTISNISASNIAFGTLPNARLPSTVSVTTLEGAGSGITSLNADNISSGTLNNSRLPSAISVTSLAGSGSGITSLNADNISSGTLANARLPSAISVTSLAGAGNAITNVNATNIGSGTINNDRLPATVSVTTLEGAGSGITSLDADNISSGTLANARLPSTISVTTMEAGGVNLGTAVANLQASNALIWLSSSNASNITEGTLANARLPATVSVTTLEGAGSGITSLNADNISSGTLANARLPSTVSVTTVEAGGVDLGTAVSNLQASNALIWSSSSNASNITAGTLANARLPGIVSVSNVNASVSMGIATTAPTANLHVVGDALVTTDLTLGSTSQFFFDESATSLYVDSSQSITGNALVVADTMYVKDNNVFVDGNVTASNIITDAIVLGAGSVSVQSISLDDVIAVNGTTTRAITVGDINSTGTVSANIKSFNITHPVLDGKRLIHACIETSRADNMYTGYAVLVNGHASIDLDQVNNMSPGTFVALNKDIRVFTTNESDWDAVKGKVDGSSLSIECQNGVSNAKVSWLVVGTRRDVPDLVVETDA